MADRPSAIPSDDALLERILERDETAFQLLYRRHASAVMAVSYRMLGDRDAAAEVTQQTFLRLWSRARSINSSAGRVRPWLLLVARNAAIDIGRRKRLGLAAFLRGFPDATAERDVAEAVVERASAREARDLLEILADDQRRVIELAYFGELTQTEIAAVLGLPLGTVKSRLRLALRRLRAHAQHFKRELR